MFNTLKSKDGLTVITEEGTISESNTIEVTTAKERDKLRTSKSKPKKLKKKTLFHAFFLHLKNRKCARLLSLYRIRFLICVFVTII